MPILVQSSSIEANPRYCAVQQGHAAAAPLPEPFKKMVDAKIDSVKWEIRGTSADHADIINKIEPHIAEIATAYDEKRANIPRFDRALLTMLDVAVDYDAGNFASVVRHIDETRGRQPRTGPKRLEALALEAYKKTAGSNRPLRIMREHGAAFRSMYSKPIDRSKLVELYRAVSQVLRQRAPVSEEHYGPERAVYSEALSQVVRNRGERDGREAVHSAFVMQADAQGAAHRRRVIRNAKAVAIDAAGIGCSVAVTAGLSHAAETSNVPLANYETCLEDELAKCPIVPVTLTTIGPHRKCAATAQQTCHTATHGEATNTRAFGVAASVLGAAASALTAGAVGLFCAQSDIRETISEYKNYTTTRRISRALEHLPIHK